VVGDDRGQHLPRWTLADAGERRGVHQVEPTRRDPRAHRRAAPMTSGSVMSTPVPSAGLASWHPVQNGEAGKGCPRPAAATTAGDFDALLGGPPPQVDPRFAGLRLVGRQAKVRPGQPAPRPRCRVRFAARQVEPEGRSRPDSQRLAQPASPYPAAARQHHDPLGPGVPGLGGVVHALSMAGACGPPLAPWASGAVWRLCLLGVTLRKSPPCL